jgi:ABC-type glycerol-3-phosphate transport system substrate-binding protein
MKRENIEKIIRRYGDKLLLVLAFSVLAVSLIRMGGKKVIEAAAPTLVFTHWWEEDAIAPLITEFENLHPEIKIQSNYRPYAEVRELLDEKDDSVGDILALDPRWLRDLVKNETLAPLGTAADPVWSAPLLSFINPFYYNIDVLKTAGFSRPPKTRGELLAMAAAITGKNAGIYGAALALDPAYPQGLSRDVFSWIWAAGAQLFNEGKPAVTSRPVVETLDFLVRLRREGFLYPNPLSLDAGEMREAFMAGRIAFMIGSIQDAEIFSRRMGEAAFGITTIPVPDAYTGKPVFGAESRQLGVSRQSNYQENARTFIDFLVGQSSVLAETMHAVPGNGIAPAELAPTYTKAWDMVNAADLVREPDDQDAGRELEAIFREELGRLFEGQYTPAAAADAIQRQWAALLAME